MAEEDQETDTNEEEPDEEVEESDSSDDDSSDDSDDSDDKGDAGAHPGVHRSTSPGCRRGSRRYRDGGAVALTVPEGYHQ